MPETISFPLSGARVAKLDNGLEVILKADRSAPLVSVQAWVKTGSLYEASLLGTGVSHLVEHMVFKGAGGRGPTELAQAVQATGGSLNAYTSFDRTVYWVDTLREGFAIALDVVAALVGDAEFPEAEYEREKDVIRREMDMGKDDPGRALGQLMFSTVFRQHPYREPVIGRLDLFNTVDRTRAMGYYQERYTPERTFLAVVGDIDPDQALEEINARIGVRTNRAMSPVILPAEPEQHSRREAHIPFATELSKMELAWRIPDLLHRSTPALEVLSVLLGQGRSSRLHREVREKQGLVHEISAGAYTPTQGGIFYISAEADPDKRTKAEAAALAEIKRIQDEGVSSAEVARARRMFLADQLAGLMSMHGQASDLAANWLVAHNLEFTRDYLHSVDQVTSEQVQNVAREYLIDAKLTSVSINPKTEFSAPGIIVPGRTSSQIKRHVYPNGLTLLVKEDPRLPLCSLHASFRGGLLSETPELSGLGRLLARTIIKGAGSRSAEEIGEAVEDGGGSIGADAGGSSFSVSVSLLQPDLALSMEVWSDVILRPHFADAVVAREKERQLAAIKAEDDHIMYVAIRELRKKLYGDHPYALTRNGTTASVTTLTPEHLRNYCAQHVNAHNAVVSVFGDVEFGHIRDLVGERLSAIPQGARRDEPDLPNLPDSAGSCIETVRPDKRQGILALGWPTVSITHPDRLALDLIDEACSDMASRMFNRIREELGLAYSVGSSQILGMTTGAFLFYLSTSPEQLDFAQTELLAEIKKLAESGLAADELDRARKTWLGKQARQNQNNSSMAQQCALDELYGLGYDHSEKVLERVTAISLADVNAAARLYFGSQSPVISRIHP